MYIDALWGLDEVVLFIICKDRYVWFQRIEFKRSHYDRTHAVHLSRQFNIPTLFNSIIRKLSLKKIGKIVKGVRVPVAIGKVDQLVTATN